MNTIQSVFRQLEDVTNSYVEALHGLVDDLITKYQNDELEEQPEVASLFADRDTIKNAVTTSHDNHLGRVVAKADELHEREDHHAKMLIEKLTQGEYKRNRHRVSEIVDMAEVDHKMINEKLGEEDYSDDDY